MSGRQNDIFDDIRRGFAAVAAQATHVKLREDKIAAYAASLPSAPPVNVLDADHHYRGGDEDTAAYILALDAINFGSGYKPALRNEGWSFIDGSIYFTVSTRLRDHFVKAGPMTAAQMRGLDKTKVKEILQLPQGSAADEFAGLCAGALRELGAMIETRADGSFMKFVEQAGGSASVLVSSLAQLENFRDVHSYKGLSVAFYKRAQIAAADLHLAFPGRNLFSDIARLTMFADNAVPHVLRTDGLLEYTPELAAKIEAGEDVPAGSDEEIEMRACAGQAVELLARAKNLRPMDVDHILWHRSAEDGRYRVRPPHRTRTVYY